MTTMFKRLKRKFKLSPLSPTNSSSAPPLASNTATQLSGGALSEGATFPQRSPSEYISPVPNPLRGTVSRQLPKNALGGLSGNSISLENNLSTILPFHNHFFLVFISETVPFLREGAFPPGSVSWVNLDKRQRPMVMAPHCVFIGPAQYIVWVIKEITNSSIPGSLLQYPLPNPSSMPGSSGVTNSGISPAREESVPSPAREETQPIQDPPHLVNQSATHNVPLRSPQTRGPSLGRSQGMPNFPPIGEVLGNIDTPNPAQGDNSKSAMTGDSLTSRGQDDASDTSRRGGHSIPQALNVREGEGSQASNPIQPLSLQADEASQSSSRVAHLQTGGDHQVAQDPPTEHTTTTTISSDDLPPPAAPDRSISTPVTLGLRTDDDNEPCTTGNVRRHISRSNTLDSLNSGNDSPLALNFRVFDAVTSDDQPSWPSMPDIWEELVFLSAINHPGFTSYREVIEWVIEWVRAFPYSPNGSPRGLSAVTGLLLIQLAVHGSSHFGTTLTVVEVSSATQGSPLNILLDSPKNILFECLKLFGPSSTPDTSRAEAFREVLTYLVERVNASFPTPVVEIYEGPLQPPEEHLIRPHLLSLPSSEISSRTSSMVMMSDQERMERRREKMPERGSDQSAQTPSDGSTSFAPSAEPVIAVTGVITTVLLDQPQPPSSTVSTSQVLASTSSSEACVVPSTDARVAFGPTEQDTLQEVEAPEVPGPPNPPNLQVVQYYNALGLETNVMTPKKIAYFKQLFKGEQRKHHRVIGASPVIIPAILAPVEHWKPRFRNYVLDNPTNVRKRVVDPFYRARNDPRPRIRRTWDELFPPPSIKHDKSYGKWVRMMKWKQDRAAARPRDPDVLAFIDDLLSYTPGELVNPSTPPDIPSELKYLEEYIEGHVDERVEGPAEQTVEEPAEQTVEEPAEQTVEEPAEQTVEEPAEAPAEPTEQNVEEPAEEPVEEPTEQTADEPAEEPVEGPAEEPQK